MNEILFRFYDVKNNDTFEVSFDKRLSFKDNFKLLSNITLINYDDIKIFEPNKNVFLDLEIMVAYYQFAYFECLYLF